MPRNRANANAHKRAEDQLLALKHMSRFIAKGMPAHDVLEGMVRQVMQYLACDSCFLYVKDGDELVLCATHDRPVSAMGNIRLRLDEGLTGWVARERRLLALPREAFKDPRFKNFTNLPEDSYEAFLSAPVLCRNQVLGVVNVQYRATHDHTGDDMEFLSTVGEFIGAFLVLSMAEPGPVNSAALLQRVMGTPAPDAPVAMAAGAGLVPPVALDGPASMEGVDQ